MAPIAGQTALKQGLDGGLQQPAPKAAKAPAQKRICRKLGEQTGSHMSKRVCLTEDEWALRDQGKSMDDLKTMGANVR